MSAARSIAHRRVAFALAATTVLLAAATLSRVDQPATQPAPRPLTTDRPRIATAAATGSVPAVTPSAARATTTDDVEAAALEFLRGYLAYLYGHGSAEEIRATTDGLRRRLAERRPRVSPATRRRHPQIRRLTVRPLPGGSGWRVTATITDGGPASYPIAVDLQDQRDGRLLVTGVVSAE